MNIRKIALLGTALLLTGALAAQGTAPATQGTPPCGPRGMGRHADPALALTAEQKTKFDAVRQKHRAALEARGKAAAEARDAMHKAGQDAATTDAALLALHAKAADAMAQVMLERRALDRDLDAILTPEQRKARGTGRHGMGPGMGRGMGPGMEHDMGRGMGPGMEHGMGRGMGPGMNGMGRGMGPGMGHGMGQAPCGPGCGANS